MCWILIGQMCRYFSMERTQCRDILGNIERKRYMSQERFAEGLRKETSIMLYA